MNFETRQNRTFSGQSGANQTHTETANQSGLSTRHASLNTLWLKAPLRPTTQTHSYCLLIFSFFTPTSDAALFSSALYPRRIFNCFSFQNNKGSKSDVDTGMDGWMDGWMAGWRWVSGWVGDCRARDLFSHDLVPTGPVFFPHSLPFFPRRVVSVSKPAVLASLGHYGIPPCHAPPSPCLRLSLALWVFPSLLTISLTLTPSLPVHLQLHQCYTTSPTISWYSAVSFFLTLFSSEADCRNVNYNKEESYTKHKPQKENITCKIFRVVSTIVMGKLACSTYGGYQSQCFTHAKMISIWYNISSFPSRSHGEMNLYLPGLTHENIFEE